MEFAAVDKRQLVLLSTGIRVADDPRGHAAREAVTKLDGDLFRYRRELKSKHDPGAVARYQDALETARRVGVDYLRAPALANLPATEVVRRLERLDDGAEVEQPGWSVQCSGRAGATVDGVWHARSR